MSIETNLLNNGTSTTTKNETEQSYAEIKPCRNIHK